ncbi:hypothetical protein [Clostridium sp. OS1-26]|uniref:hypothetical protein n=1 Tax=Clostridium sp. OS1-26 TaxID=3070681 RepID=UPI0027E0F792|nr:hypothetical protein [Clostridium sp. OS1-26]WML36788.1 hypothetical protein RCG18_09270 [Clostridium sp. OS1-26]
MKRNTLKVLLACTVASVLIISSVAATTVKAAGVAPPENTNEHETAAKVSQGKETSNSYYTVKLNGKELKMSKNLSSKKADKKDDKKENKKNDKNEDKKDNKKDDKNEDKKNGNKGEQNLRLLDTQVSNWVKYVEQKHPQGLHAIADVSQSNHKLTIKLANPNDTLYGAYSKFVNKYNLQHALGQAQNILFDEKNGYAVTKVVKVGHGNKTVYDANSQDKTVSTLLESALSLNDLQDAEAFKSIKYKDLKGNYKVYLKYKGENISTPYMVQVD